MIYGFSGKMGSGKNYIAERIFIPMFEKMFPKRKVIHLAFADQLKINCIVKYNLDRNNVYYNKPPRIRSLLQSEGTEFGRNVYGNDIWVKYTQEWIYLFETKGFTDFVITDMRFTNEAEFVKNNYGKLIRVESPSQFYSTCNNTTKTHVSETDLDNYKEFDLVLLNKKTQEHNQLLETTIKNFLLNSELEQMC
jgi:hypothetical protein